MADERRLVLDANILMRAVLGRRVRQIIESYVEHAAFFAPDVAFADAHRHLPNVVRKQGGEEAAVAAALEVLEAVCRNVVEVEAEAYVAHRTAALARIERRDPDDWPILAAAMALDCPVWTEDNDFFGTGVPTWTSDRVELYLKAKE
ncbi:MAG TPA: PIN domain-containing protein [Nocardioidaceae bacterium]|nr:PIN domain-containing protein [Nocardioidaceae bacterium]